MWAFIFSINVCTLLSAWAHIISLDLGADQWVLGLCPKHSIYAVTYLAKSSHYSYLHKKAQGVPTHRGQTESLLNPKIKIAVATTHPTRLTKRILAHQKIRLLQLKDPQSIKDIDMQKAYLQTELKLDHQNPSRLSTTLQKKKSSKTRILFYTGPNGMCPGRHTLIGDILSRLGCTPLPHRYWRALSEENILAYNPDHILFTSTPPSTPFWKTLKKRCQFHHVPLRFVLTAYPQAVADFAQFVRSIMQ